MGDIMLLVNKIVFVVLSISIIVLFVIFTIKEFRRTDSNESFDNEDKDCKNDFENENTKQ